MKALISRYLQRALRALLRVGQRIDYAWLLPLIARFPLTLAYALANLRGHTHATCGWDWRSLALGFRHVRQQTDVGYHLLAAAASEQDRLSWRHERFVVEARDAFEASLIAVQRVQELHCEILPGDAAALAAERKRGLLLLTPHFDSFFLGVAFLARSGAKVNLMSSTVTQDPRIDAAVQQHFSQKYRGLEHYLNGGQVLDMEVGLRPFFRMLQAHETLVVLGDAPATPHGVAMTVDFLGLDRLLAGGALRMAQSTGSDLGGYLCRYLGPGRYELVMCPIGPADDPQTVARLYRFFSDSIQARPGLWWAADLLPQMPQASLGLVR
jgi:lauroyl/myristoyl acyltransferase